MYKNILGTTKEYSYMEAILIWRSNLNRPKDIFSYVYLGIFMHMHRKHKSASKYNNT